MRPVENEDEKTPLVVDNQQHLVRWSAVNDSRNFWCGETTQDGDPLAPYKSGCRTCYSEAARWYPAMGDRYDVAMYRLQHPVARWFKANWFAAIVATMTIAVSIAGIVRGVY